MVEERRSRPLDLAIALGCWLLSTSPYLLELLTRTPAPYQSENHWLLLLLMLGLGSAQTLPLIWRRTHPETTFVVICSALAAQLVFWDSPLPSNLGYLFALFGLAAHTSNRSLSLAGLATAVVSGPVAVIDWSWGYRSGDSLLGAAIQTLLLSGLAVVCWILGDVSRQRRLVIERLADQNAALLRDHDQRVALAAQQERARIAREMHDIVAHGLSVIVVQADGAAFAARHAGTWKPDQAAAALETIAGTARSALADTRRLVGLLRDQSGVEYAPTAAIADLGTLVTGLQHAGHQIQLTPPADELGSLGELPRDIELAVYRVVQESLTNIIKHAGPAARGAVRLDRVGDTLLIRIEDDGQGNTAVNDGSGNGLVGMRERITALGGTLTAGPTGRGYLVQAALPLQPTGGTA